MVRKCSKRAGKMEILRKCKKFRDVVLTNCPHLWLESQNTQYEHISTNQGRDFYQLIQKFIVFH